MKLKRIIFTEGEKNEFKASTVTVEMSVEEAIGLFPMEIPPIKFESTAVKTQTVEEWADEHRAGTIEGESCLHADTQIESVVSMPGNKSVWFEVKCSSCGITGPRAANEKGANTGWGLGFRKGYMEDKNNG